MLTPEYLQKIADGAEQLANDLHIRTIIKIIERILKRLERGDDYILTAIDKWQLETLQEAGFLMEELRAEIASATPYQLKEIKAAFEDAGVRALEYDDAVYSAAGLSPTPLKQSPYLVRLMQRNYEATAGTWKNLTRTHAEAAQQFFIKECDAAYNLVSTGAVSYTEAFRDAINTIAHDGVKITYPSGHEDTIETATLRCVRTGVSQATADITDARMDEMDWDIVLVSSHLGARVTDKDDFTNHAWWQGKFYSRSGKDKRFQPFEVCGRGHVQGINGANCRHSYGPGDGEHNPYEQYDSEENRKAYELSQRQRLLERRIRATKREVMGLQAAVENAPKGMKADLERDYQRKAALLQKQNKAYNRFCEEHGRKKLADRTTIAGWGRKEASKATAAARKKPSNSKKVLQSSAKRDMLNEEEEHAINNYISSSSYPLNYKLRNGIELSGEEQNMADNLDSALTKMPIYKGAVYRSLSLAEIENLNSFWDIHQPENMILYPAYTSTSTAVYDEGMDIQMVIVSKRGRDIRKYNPNEREILFARDSKFLCVEVKDNTIYLEEIADNE